MSKDRPSASTQIFEYPLSGLPVHSHWPEIVPRGTVASPISLDAPSSESTIHPAADQMKKAFENGRVEGVEEGRRIELLEGKARFEQCNREKIEHVSRINEQFALERDSFMKAVEPEVVKLALRIAERIIRHEVQVDPLILTGAVRVALSQLADKTTVRIHVPAVDSSLWSETIDHLPNLRLKPAIVADEHLGTGECRLESSVGSADLSVQSQLREIRQGLLGRNDQDLLRNAADIDGEERT